MKYMFVTKRNGNTEQIQFDKITNRISKLVNKEEKEIINPILVAQKVISSIYDGITTEELDIESAKICANLCTTHPLYSNLGGRILSSNLQKKTTNYYKITQEGHRIKTIKRTFSEKMNLIKEETDLLSDKFIQIINENSKRLDNMIDYNRDYMFDYFGFKTLERAYLIKNLKTKEIYECPQDMWLRVAVQICQGNMRETKKLYDLMSNGYYTHASPTLFNSGTQKSQLSSCFLLGTHDSLDGITDTWKAVSNISKWGGGIGLHVSNIRAKNSIIRGTNGPSSGIIPMLKVYNEIARYVNQCFIGETKIYTDKGLIPIKDLKVGDYVYTNDGSLQNILKIYNDQYNNNVLDLKIMHNFEQPTSVTPEHPFYVIKNQELETDYNVITNRLDRGLIHHEWVEAKNLTENDMICIPIPKYEKDCNSYSESDCYIYGIILSNGHIYNNKVKIILDKNKDVIKDSLINYLELNTIDYCESENDNSFCISWTITSKFKFTKNQFYNKNNSKNIDKLFLNLPIEKSKWIVKGLLDSFSIIDDELILEFESQQVIESVKYILLKMGILTSGYLKDDNIWCLNIPRTLEISKLMNIEETTNIKFFRYNDNLYTRLESIEERKIDETVYDLEIESNHNYLTEIGLVHNGGKRKGSIAIYLEPHHADIMEFLDLRKNFGDENMRARDLFLALWVSDLFMKQAENDKEWYLMCPDECPGLSDVWGEEYEKLYWQYVNDGKYRKKIMARDILNAVWESQFETGTPYILFKDSVNAKSNHQNIGTIKSSNLCSEVIEYSDENNHAVCNLASIALNKMCVPFDNENKRYIVYTKPDCIYCYWSKTWLDNKNYNYDIILCDNDDKIKQLKTKVNKDIITFPQIYVVQDNPYIETYIGGFEELVKYHGHTYDFDKLYDVAYTATKNLDRVIDINFYPTPQTKRSNFKTRPLGLGIQGLADTLVLMKIPFESLEALELNKDIMETIYYASLSASCDIARDRQKNMISFLRMYQENPETIPEIYDDEFVLENSELNELYHLSRVNEVDLVNFTENDSCHGAYSLYHGSPVSKGILQHDMWGAIDGTIFDWNDLRKRIKKYGVRNSLLVALMPTASTSQILGNNVAFEFFNSNIFTRSTLAGDFPIMNKYLVDDLLLINKWSKELKDLIIFDNGSVQDIEGIPRLFKDLYKTQYEIKQRWVLEHASARAPYVDQTQSMNIFFKEPNNKFMYSCMLYAWKKGLKTGNYYIRSKPVVNATKFTIDPKLKEQKYEECESCSA